MTNTTTPHPAVLQFLAMLNQADSVDIDGPLLTSWTDSPPTGEGSNEVVKFSWIDEEGSYQIIMTEEGISNGQWVGNSFFCRDHEGDEIQVSLYKHEAVMPHVCADPTISAAQPTALTVREHRLGESRFAQIKTSASDLSVLLTDGVSASESLMRSAAELRRKARRLLATAVLYDAAATIA